MLGYVNAKCGSLLVEKLKPFSCIRSHSSFTSPNLRLLLPVSMIRDRPVMNRCTVPLVHAACTFATWVAITMIAVAFCLMFPEMSTAAMGFVLVYSIFFTGVFTGFLIRHIRQLAFPTRLHAIETRLFSNSRWQQSIACHELSMEFGFRYGRPMFGFLYSCRTAEWWRIWFEHQCGSGFFEWDDMAMQWIPPTEIEVTQGG